MALLEFLDRFPPRLCRLVAREKRGRRALTTRQIARRSGLATGTVSEISRRKTTWRGLKIETVEAFARGCGVDHFRLKKDIKFLKQAKWIHMRKNQRYFRRLMA